MKVKAQKQLNHPNSCHVTVNVITQCTNDPHYLK